MRRLREKIEMHSTLNPNIWAEDNHLRLEVKDKLEEIVVEFLTELEENEIPIHILDVHLVGSNASYNYTDQSDLDVHIIVNLEDVTCDPYILNLLYGYFKSYFNNKYDISIHGVNVELYIEDVNTSSISNGIYSLFDDEWVKFPEKIEVPDVDISKDITPYKNMYDSAMKSKDGMEAIMLVNDLYLLRRNSLSIDGEYGVGNLIFKEFRNNGWLDNLKDLSNEYKSETLTLEQLNESLNDFMSMEHLISEAKERGVRPRDLFDKYDYLVDAEKFFNYMVSGTERYYQTAPQARILNNRPYNEFYKTLLGYLDSLGTNKPYSKIEPALVKKLPNGSLQPLDGRHRSQFCMMLDIPLPVRVQQQGANKDYESLEGSLNKVSSNKVTNSKLGSSIKSRVVQSNVIVEDYLDDRSRFWNYHTRHVDKDNIFDPSVGESSYAKDMVRLAKTGQTDEEGHYASYVEMSPKEYFDACAKGFGIPAATQINTVSSDRSIIQVLNTILDKYKVRFPVAYLDYSFNNFSQEGRHRMYVAGERFGWDKKFPVLVIHTTAEADEAKHAEKMSRYISKALDRTERYTYRNFDEIKEQFLYDIEDLLSNPKVEFKETVNTYIFIVNGVEYEEEKDSFNFYNEEDKTNINDIDVEDFLDLDDLSDDDIFNM